MHLVDTSVWVDHLRHPDAVLVGLLAAGDVLVHPFIVGEIACGVFSRRAETLALLNFMPSVPMVSHGEMLGFIERHDLAGRGIGFVDLHLLAAARVAHARVWTRDKRLAEAAARLDVGARDGP